MKKLLLTGVVFLGALCAYSEPIPADDILAFVRTKLPNDPLKITGSLRIKAPNGFTKAHLPVVMELDWGAAAPTATYRIDKEILTITWNNDIPNYRFTNPKNKPSDDILDSGVNWSDLSFSFLWWPGSRLVDEGKKLDRSCYIVEVPVPDSENTMRLWIEKKMGMLMESLTVNKKGKPVRRLKIKSIKKMEGMWIGSDLEIKNMLTGSKTDLIVKHMEWKEPKPTAEAFDAAESINTLTFDLYKKLAAGQEGNLFFSPYSISSALAMTFGGARGETAEEMNQTLHFGGQGATHPAFAYLRSMLNTIQEKGHVQLSVANSLWPQKDYAFLPDYLAMTKEYYGSEIQPVDYKADTEGARLKINGWVEDQTNDKIKDLIAQGVLDPLTRLVLANAIYFNGNWGSQFKKEATHPAPFTLADGAKIDVSMMSQTGDFNLARTDKFQAVEIPYEGDNLSMVILLPLPGEKSDLVSLNDLAFQKQKVLVQLPKFKIETEFYLGKTFTALGMPLAFSTQADFSGMDGSRNLFIGEVIHKAFVEVDEEGTEAAAATAVGIRTTSMPPQFVADHPFLFLIRENSTGTILFIGRVTDPSK